MSPHLRIARPASDPRRIAAMYCEALRWEVLGSFEDHDGFDGVMVGPRGGPHHLEFTRHRAHVVMPTPTAEDLLVFYLPERAVWDEACERFVAAGFRDVASFNPYWSAHGRTFVDPDGYRVVVQRDAWGT
jgi:hypothetical protein